MLNYPDHFVQLTWVVERQFIFKVLGINHH